MRFASKLGLKAHMHSKEAFALMERGYEADPLTLALVPQHMKVCPIDSLERCQEAAKVVGQSNRLVG